MSFIQFYETCFILMAFCYETKESVKESEKYPDKCATGYRRLCIVYRNRYIIENTDFIIAYNRYQGKAYEFCKQAKGKGVKVIELGKN